VTVVGQPVKRGTVMYVGECNVIVNVTSLSRLTVTSIQRTRLEMSTTWFRTWNHGLSFCNFVPGNCNSYLKFIMKQLGASC